MNWFKKHLSGLNVALSVSTVMCFVQFTASAWGMIRFGHINSDTITNLLSSFDGFEAVILFFVTLAVNRKKVK